MTRRYVLRYRSHELGSDRYVLRTHPWLAAKAVLWGAAMTWCLLSIYGFSVLPCLYGAAFAVAVLLEL